MELSAGLDNPQAFTACEGAGTRSHWLERDKVLALRRENLCVPVVLKKLQGNPTTAR
jgi:hypothetical protein